MSEQGTQTSTQVQKPKGNAFAGTFESAEAVNQRLEWALANAHLVSPITAVTRLPEGVGVALSLERLDIERDTYGLPGGKRAILKPALERIGRAAGVKWDAAQCFVRQVGLHHYQAQAVGYVLDLSFQAAPIMGTVDMDYGPGSIGEEKVLADARDKAAAQKTLREIRHFLSRHAESRAYLRAIRRLGIATSYTPEQLIKPFAALQLTWTGRSSDPETQRMFSKMTAERLLGAKNALYGGEKPAPTATAPAAPSAPVVDATPRLSAQRTETVHDFIDYDEETGEVRQPVAASRERPATQQRSTSSPRSNGANGASRSGPVFRFGKSKDSALADASPEDLAWYRAKIAEGADDPSKEKFRADALLHLAEIDRALGSSRGEVGEPTEDDRAAGSPDDY